MSTLREGQAIHRYEVPVDDQWHEVVTGGGILHVAIIRSHHTVEFWAPEGELVCRWYRAVGTGHPCPSEAEYEGTATFIAGAYPLVWHLVSRNWNTTPAGAQ